MNYGKTGIKVWGDLDPADVTMHPAAVLRTSKRNMIDAEVLASQDYQVEAGDL